MDTMSVTHTPVVVKDESNDVIFSVVVETTKNLDEVIKLFAKRENILIEDWLFFHNNKTVNQHRTIRQFKGLENQVLIHVVNKKKRDRFDNERKREHEMTQTETLCKYKCDALLERVELNTDLHTLRDNIETQVQHIES